MIFFQFAPQTSSGPWGLFYITEICMRLNFLLFFFLTSTSIIFQMQYNQSKNEIWGLIGTIMKDILRNPKTVQMMYKIINIYIIDLKIKPWKGKNIYIYIYNNWKTNIGFFQCLDKFQGRKILLKKHRKLEIRMRNS